VTTFFRLRDVPVEHKAKALRTLAEQGHARSDNSVFDCKSETFMAIPGAPFSYWLTDKLRDVFEHVSRFESPTRSAKQGLVTTDDGRFLRLWYEVHSLTPSKWYAFAKGGAYSPYYSDVFLVVDWSYDGAQSWAIYQARKDVVGGIIKNSTFYFRPGLTWSLRAEGLSFRVLPSACIFSHKGPAVFAAGDHPVTLLSTAAVLNSQTFSFLVAAQVARTELAQSYEVGLIRQTPFAPLSAEDTALLADLARRAWSLKKSLDITNETSHAFILPTAQIGKVIDLDQEMIERSIATIKTEIDTRASTLYGIGPEDRAMIEASEYTHMDDESATTPQGDSESEVDGDVDIAQTDALISWFMGVAFGRFDIRLATGERKPPPEPEPFDPLPTRSPGMWPEGEPRDVEPPAILVDDPGHKLDLTKAVAAVAERIGADEPDKLRGWLAKELFPLHIKMYSKSRRKAPIYWQLATPSASYSVWLYLHAFTKDSLFHVQELVTTKAEHEERVLERLRSEQQQDSSTSASRKALAAQEAFVDELRGMLEEVTRVKPLWQPDLDDGVVINFAPLWRLVPHHKPWQKELRTTWDSLVAGEYDWAHLAMHLWPERVVPKCATDRSFAIAHGLEDVFWWQDDAGKWKPRATPTRPVADLVAERSSTAVQAARDSLLTAASPGGGSGKARRKRATGPRSRG
jgi:hypothetical protein